MNRLVDAEEVLAMFCGDCAYRGEPPDFSECFKCEIKQRINLAEEKPQCLDFSKGRNFKVDRIECKEYPRVARKGILKFFFGDS